MYRVIHYKSIVICLVQNKLRTKHCISQMVAYLKSQVIQFVSVEEYMYMFVLLSTFHEHMLSNVHVINNKLAC